MSHLYVGLMSGTSADGIDAALVDFSDTKPILIGSHYEPYPADLRDKIFALYQKDDNEIQRAGELDVILGKKFADTAIQLIKKHNIDPSLVKAIGSHGQTIRHYPHHPHRFSMQIGDPNTIATETGIITIADFRRKDIALGGQGAPLVPAFHQQVFAGRDTNRAIVNIGGIANITLLSQKSTDKVVGFDTGPGNCVMDAWIQKHQNTSHDANGNWAMTGTVHPQLLKRLLSDIYFQLPPPKSTGREHFNLMWLQKHLDALQVAISPESVQATLTDLTARTIITSIRQYFSSGEILICGGGAHNQFLMTRLTGLAQPHFGIATTSKYGVHPDWVEAMAFAWLARQTMHQLPGNLPAVTGAKRAAVLGGIYLPN